MNVTIRIDNGQIGNSINRFPQPTGKTAHAEVLLHYQTRAPFWLLRTEEKLWN